MYVFLNNNYQTYALMFSQVLSFYSSLSQIRTLAYTSILPANSTVCQYYSIFLLFTVRDGFLTPMGKLNSKNTNSPKLPVFTFFLLSPENRARCADDQTDLWYNRYRPFAPCKLENQRQDFRMALEQRLSSLCYLITNFHRLLSFSCTTSFFVFL